MAESSGHGKSQQVAIPPEFADVYLCDQLGITWTQLQEQPAEWVQRMMLWLNAKATATQTWQKQVKK